MIVHTTPPAERRAILERFRAGRYTKLATGRVLNEGVDVPDASVAIVVSGSGTRREHIQRLGRILRPKAGGAVLYELITRDTAEPRVARRRRATGNGQRAGTATGNGQRATGRDGMTRPSDTFRRSPTEKTRVRENIETGAHRARFSSVAPCPLPVAGGCPWTG